MAFQIQDSWLNDGFERLRAKWSTVPAGGSRRISSSELLKLDDIELARIWTAARDADVQGTDFQMRGWYHELYREFMMGKKVLDIGCGLGISSISFAQMGAAVTFVDIVEDNIRLVERVCRVLGIADRVSFYYMHRIDDLAALPRDFDVVTAMGSLHHAPFEFVHREVAEIVRHLKIGGRWLQLAYPKARWVREGSLSFSEWGERTDGEGTPYAEWYDLNKLLQLLTPAKFDPLFHCEWHNYDFNWFDLKLLTYDGGVVNQNEEDPILLELCLLREALKRNEEELNVLKAQLESCKILQQEHTALIAHVTAIENSAGWRLLTRWHRVRNRIVPDGTRRRRFYDALRGVKR